MKQAGLLSTPRRGTYRIAPRGLEVLRSKPQRIDNELLSRFAELNEFRERSRHRTARDATNDPDVETPQERLDAAYLGLRESIEAELLQQVKAASPPFFEQLVVQLLVKMGYGGSLEDAGRAVGRSGDGGIDGIINEDRLGLDVVHIQAKRWDQKTIGRPDVQSFAGSLDGVRARKGIFITTSSFSQDARSYVERIDKRIALIDGVTLARLLFDFGVGVTTVAAYDVKRIDADFFAEE